MPRKFSERKGPLDSVNNKKTRDPNGNPLVPGLLRKVISLIKQIMEFQPIELLNKVLEIDKQMVEFVQKLWSACISPRSVPESKLGEGTGALEVSARNVLN